MSNYKDSFSAVNSPALRDGDVEAQRAREASKQTDAGVEYTVPTAKKLIALSFYFFLSLALTIQSKMLLGKVRWEYPDLAHPLLT